MARKSTSSDAWLLRFEKRQELQKILLDISKPAARDVRVQKLQELNKVLSSLEKLTKVVTAPDEVQFRSKTLSGSKKTTARGIRTQKLPRSIKALSSVEKSAVEPKEAANIQSVSVGAESTEVKQPVEDISSTRSIGAYASIPIIRSVAHSVVVDGQGRNDLVLAEEVQCSDINPANIGHSYLWSFTDVPIGSNANIVDAASPTCLFHPDVTGSYELNCTVDSAAYSVEILAVPLPNTRARIPAFSETLEYTGGGNAKGWHEALTQFMRAADNEGANGPSGPSGPKGPSGLSGASGP